MLEKIKTKISRTMKAEITKEAKRGIKKFLPKLFTCLAIISMLLMKPTQTVRQPSQTVNNYYIYNGPVYSHE